MNLYKFTISDSVAQSFGGQTTQKSPPFSDTCQAMDAVEMEIKEGNLRGFTEIILSHSCIRAAIPSRSIIIPVAIFRLILHGVGPILWGEQLTAGTGGRDPVEILPILFMVGNQAFTGYRK